MAGRLTTAEGEGVILQCYYIRKEEHLIRMQTPFGANADWLVSWSSRGSTPLPPPGWIKHTKNSICMCM
jgi:hypothetical protein